MLLKIEKLTVAYGDMVALRDVSFFVDEGEVVSLVGSNGSGKTTLLRCISGIIGSQSGRISFGETSDITKMAPSAIVNLGLIQVPEERLLFPSLTVLENLEMGAFSSRARAYYSDTLQEVFELFPILTERQKQKANTLSGGEQQMLAIGRALMARPRMLICDEPSLGLAPVIVKHIFEIIRLINERGVSIFLVEQNVKQALSISHRGYVLENGSVKLSGTGKELITNKHIEKVYLGL
jgi:branched-chain amino acid transport system ATP-binding protein